jgi:hypothetical protein
MNFDKAQLGQPTSLATRTDCLLGDGITPAVIKYSAALPILAPKDFRKKLTVYLFRLKQHELIGAWVGKDRG